MPSPAAHGSRLCNRAEEYDHAGSSERAPRAHKRVPWNKGKATGAKPPLRPKHVWSIRTKLQIEGRTRDLAMFNLAIDSKLRGCDVVAIRVEDVAASGYTDFRCTPINRRSQCRPYDAKTSQAANLKRSKRNASRSRSGRSLVRFDRAGDE